MTCMTREMKYKFKNVNEAIGWLSTHDRPDESEYDCDIKHRILYRDCSNPSWFEFKSDETLLEWIQEQRDSHD